MAVYGYRRVSSDGQEDGTSLQEQERRINALADLKGLDRPTLFEDVCSGSIPLANREGGASMIASLGKGDSVIVTKLDRVFRNATDALAQADWFKARGINLYLIDMGVDPVTNDGASRMFFGMLALVAEFERTRIHARTQDGKKAKSAKGGHVGGSRPFGYDVIGKGKAAVLMPRKGEFEFIASILDRRAAGDSLRSISTWLASEGIKLSHVGVGNVRDRAA
ncbi:recombinase family protein [Methylobacterium sp. B4]|uniref:recombinase family protein n=1 Tax=Methylobacterium sp. B4 TaxID=1938755 RepID=UPI000D774BF8|nr:recombinase family protein [Methylobacterium sp. B4]PXW65871.1 DNA invertase Pin-like site-specific DNA recombinase [Methylobacterium sp. B4]